jgi:hypothetical protein
MDFDFQANWSEMTTLPPSGTRCIVTDGDVIVIATYLYEESGNIWIFSGLTESDSNKFRVQSWMELPKPKKIVLPPVIYENKTDRNQ